MTHILDQKSLMRMTEIVQRKIVNRKVAPETINRRILNLENNATTIEQCDIILPIPYDYRFISIYICPATLLILLVIFIAYNKLVVFYLFLQTFFLSFFKLFLSFFFQTGFIIFFFKFFLSFFSSFFSNFFHHHFFQSFLIIFFKLFFYNFF